MGAKPTKIRVSMLLLIGLLVFSSCTDNGSNPAVPASSAARITPPNEATAVPLDASVTLQFATAVNRSTVEGATYLIAEPAMYDSCPDPAMGYPGTMDEIMRSPLMMRHMDQYHSTPGHFTWSADGTICTFHPDSLMLHGTCYMLHLRGTTGGVMGVCYRNTGGDIMTHFHTVEAAH